MKRLLNSLPLIEYKLDEENCFSSFELQWRHSQIKELAPRVICLDKDFHRIAEKYKFMRHNGLSPSFLIKNEPTALLFSMLLHPESILKDQGSFLFKNTNLDELSDISEIKKYRLSIVLEETNLFRVIKSKEIPFINEKSKPDGREKIFIPNWKGLLYFHLLASSPWMASPWLESNLLIKNHEALFRRSLFALLHYKGNFLDSYISRVPSPIRPFFENELTTLKEKLGDDFKLLSQLFSPASLILMNYSELFRILELVALNKWQLDQAFDEVDRMNPTGDFNRINLELEIEAGTIDLRMQYLENLFNELYQGLSFKDWIATNSSENIQI